MKTKEKKAKGKGKAIIGIALAAIMLASVMAAMVTPAAAFVRDARTVAVLGVGNAVPGNIAVIGELITLDDAAATQIQYATWDDYSSTYVGTGQILSATVVGIDTAAATTAGVYITNVGNCLTLASPVLDLRLQIGTVDVSSVVIGQRIDVVVDTNIPGAIGTIPPLAAPTGGSNDLKLRIRDKDTDVETIAGIGAPAAGAPIGTMWSVITGAGGLPAGDYTIRVETYTTGNARAAIDISSADKYLTVRTQEISIEADVTEQTTGNDVVLTVSAGATVGVTVTLAGATGVFDTNKGDYPGRALAGSTATTFIATIPSDGTLTAVITSITPGAVTVTAFVTADPTVRDTIDVRFKELQTTVEVSTDKEEYSPRDVMAMSIHLSNPTADTQKLLFKWYIGIPEYDLWAEMTAKPVNLPPGYDQMVTVTIPVGHWGTESFCGCHIVSLTDTTTKKVVSVDSTAWIYIPSAISKSKTSAEIAKEIKKGVEGVELPS